MNGASKNNNPDRRFNIKDMTTIQQYSNQAEAYIDKGYLESHGIPAEVQSDALSEIFPAPGAGIGSISLIVPDKYAAEAEHLMNNRP